MPSTQAASPTRNGQASSRCFRKDRDYETTQSSAAAMMHIEKRGLVLSRIWIYLDLSKSFEKIVEV